MNLLPDRLALIYKENPTLEGDRGQTGLVKASGATKSVVNQWLEGKIKKMGLRYALELERSLGYSHLWLMSGEGDPRGNAGGQVAFPNKQTVSTGTRLANPDPETQAVIDMMAGTDAEGRVLVKNAVVDALMLYEKRKAELLKMILRQQKVAVETDEFAPKPITIKNGSS